MTVTRREWLALIGSAGSALLLGGCGASSPPVVTAATTGADSPSGATFGTGPGVPTSAGTASSVLATSTDRSSGPTTAASSSPSAGPTGVVTSGRPRTGVAPTRTDRTVPSAPGSTGAPSPADVQTGRYAARLLDAAALTAALGTPCPAPTASGGRLSDAAGIDVSTAQVASTTGRYSVEYSVFLGSAPAVAAFYATQAASGTSVSGPWKAGAYLDSIGTFYCYVGDRGFQIRVIDLQISEAPTRAQTDALQELAVAVAVRLTRAVAG